MSDREHFVSFHWTCFRSVVQNVVIGMLKKITGGTMFLPVCKHSIDMSAKLYTEKPRQNTNDPKTHLGNRDILFIVIFVFI